MHTHGHTITLSSPPESPHFGHPRAVAAVALMTSPLVLQSTLSVQHSFVVFYSTAEHRLIDFYHTCELDVEQCVGDPLHEEITHILRPVHCSVGVVKTAYSGTVCQTGPFKICNDKNEIS